MPADEQENLREERRFLELLEVENLRYDGFHDVVIEQRFRGTLPEDKEKLLALTSLDTPVEFLIGEYVKKQGEML